jgi:hypothetical protein
MPAASVATALPNDPAPATDPAAGGGPTHPIGDRMTAHPSAGRVLSLLRKLIDYGQDLARTVQQRAAVGVLFTVAVHFGTRDMALILRPYPGRAYRQLMMAQAKWIMAR